LPDGFTEFNLFDGANGLEAGDLLAGMREDKKNREIFSSVSV